MYAFYPEIQMSCDFLSIYSRKLYSGEGNNEAICFSTLHTINTSPASTRITNQEWEDIKREAGTSGSEEGIWRGDRYLEGHRTHGTCFLASILP
jgi:hypothetical protein